jgi:prepilin-type N-terminal cleavage/methylation domain-containing protein
MTNRRTRSAFTLVELLVAIAIIVILMGLSLVVISRVWMSVDVSKTVVEIGQIADGCELFKQKMGRYPAARIVLDETGAAYTANVADTVNANGELARYSVEYLQAIFPGINLFMSGGGPGHDWNGDGVFQGIWVLEGEEAVVFWLSGMRYGAAGSRTQGQGFNTDKTRPTLQTTSQRLGPFFEFDESRIAYTSPNASAYPFGASGGLFPIYNDRWGTPYAYLAARTGTMNNYYYRGVPTGPVITQSTFPPNFAPTVNPAYLYDCDRLFAANGSPNFVPYWQSQTPQNPSVPTGAQNFSFYKPDRYMIISAGRDKLFGAGGRYDPTNPEMFLASPADHDNLFNGAATVLVPK